MAARNYYETLGIVPDADFATLRKAYRDGAKRCHPDLFGGAPAKAEAFKHLVEAFNCLSDPVRRREHDLTLDPAVFSSAHDRMFVEEFPEDEGSILDTYADDILEEMIVGNTVPRDTSIRTLMLDLEQTDRFCLFREAKTCLYTGRVKRAEVLFARYLGMVPYNILGRYFLARTYIVRGRFRDAQRELAAALRIGGRREPPLRLRRIRSELDQLRRRRPGLAASLRRLFSAPVDPDDNLTAGEREVRALNRALSRLAQEMARNPRRPARKAIPERGRSERDNSGSRPGAG